MPEQLEQLMHHFLGDAFHSLDILDMVIKVLPSCPSILHGKVPGVRSLGYPGGPADQPAGGRAGQCGGSSGRVCPDSCQQGQHPPVRRHQGAHKAAPQHQPGMWHFSAATSRLFSSFKYSHTLHSPLPSPPCQYIHKCFLLLLGFGQALLINVTTAVGSCAMDMTNMA